MAMGGDGKSWRSGHSRVLGKNWPSNWHSTCLLPPPLTQDEETLYAPSVHHSLSTSMMVNDPAPLPTVSQYDPRCIYTNDLADSALSRSPKDGWPLHRLARSSSVNIVSNSLQSVSLSQVFIFLTRNFCCWWLFKTVTLKKIKTTTIKCWGWKEVLFVDEVGQTHSPPTVADYIKIHIKTKTRVRSQCPGRSESDHTKQHKLNG